MDDWMNIIPMYILIDGTQRLFLRTPLGQLSNLLIEHGGIWERFRAIGRLLQRQHTGENSLRVWSATGDMALA